MKNHWTTLWLCLGMFLIAYLPLGNAQNRLLLDFGTTHQGPQSSFLTVNAEQYPRNFAWVSPPNDHFYRPKFAAIRAPEWLDGVIGKSLEFTINLSPGN